MAGSIIPYKSFILKTAHSIVLGNGELYEVGRFFFKLSTYYSRKKKPELKWKKKITPLENCSADICWQIIFI